MPRTKGLSFARCPFPSLTKKEKNTSSAYLVLHHNDLDGLLCSCFFSIRGPRIMNIEHKKIFYHPVAHGVDFDINFVTKKIIAKTKAQNVKILLFDYALTPKVTSWLSSLDECEVPVSLHLVIDHHLWPSEAKDVLANLTVHEPLYPSCASLVAKTFSKPNPHEDPEAVKRTLEAIDIIDSGGVGCTYEEFLSALTTEPGCLAYYDVFNKLPVDDARALLCAYLLGCMDKRHKQIMSEFAGFMTRAMNENPIPFKTTKVKGKTVAFYVFHDNRADNLLYLTTTAKSAFVPPADYLIYYLESHDKADKSGAKKYRISVRTGDKDFPIADFCREWGGGGRSWGAGGFQIKLKPADVVGSFEDILNKLYNYL